MKKLLCLSLCFLCFSLSAQESDKTFASKQFQDDLNEEFSNPKESPLSKEDFKNFKGLEFYPISEKYIVEAKLVRSENENIFKMKTSTTRTPEYKKYGELFFSIDGIELMLNVYQNIEYIKTEGHENDLFLPFFDLTNDVETYMGGRYLDLTIPIGDVLTIDFNQAYNPYCAYNHLYSCPLVPMENDLDIEILAGVKKFHD